jgi:hypothetical protein
VASDNASVFDNSAAAGQSEVFLQVIFFRTPRRKIFHPGSDLNEAFLALALFTTGSGDFYPKQLGAIKERRTSHGAALLVVEM